MSIINYKNYSHKKDVHNSHFMATYGSTFRKAKLILETLNWFWHIWLPSNRIIFAPKNWF